MENLGILITIVALLALFIFIILGLVSLVIKNGKSMKHFKIAGISLAAAIFGFFLFGFSYEDSKTPSTTEVAEEVIEETPEERAEREAQEKAEAEAEAEQKAKEEAEAKAKAEAEAKARAEAEAKAAEEAAAKKANAQPIEYAHLKKNPDRYAGEYVKYTGEIIQIMEGDDITTIRLAVTKDEWGYNYDDVIYIEYSGLTDYIEEDIITVYGEIYGEYSYTSQAGWEISIPALIADSFE